MTLADIMRFIYPSKVFNSDTLLNFIFREDLYEAKCIESFSNIIDSVIVTADKNGNSLFSTGNEFSTSEIGVFENDSSRCILIDLKGLFRFNHIEFKLQYKPNIWHKYFIEVSRNGIDWTRIVNYEKPGCHGFQNLYFAETSSRFIKTVGTGSNSSKVLEINAFQVNFVDNPPRFCNGFVFPLENVAVPTKAYVNTTNKLHTFEWEKQLLNGYYEDNGINTPFTQQVIKYGDIVIEFQQPYMLDSCRFKLWEYDGRKYSYKVKTTLDFITFETIFDKSEELVNGWQLIKFSPRPVMRFLIIGVKASVGTELRLVHFEAPAQVFE